MILRFEQFGLLVIHDCSLIICFYLVTFCLIDGAERSIIDELTTLASVERPRSYTRQEAACQSRVINRIRVPDVDAIPTRVVGKTIDRRDDAIVELDETYAELLEWAGAVATGFTLPIDRSIGSFNVDDAFVSDWLVCIRFLFVGLTF